MNKEEQIFKHVAKAYEPLSDGQNRTSMTNMGKKDKIEQVAAILTDHLNLASCSGP